MARAEPPRDLTRREIALRPPGEQREPAIEQGHPHVLAIPGAQRAKQRAHRGERRVEAPGRVRDLAADTRRLPVHVLEIQGHAALAAVYREKEQRLAVHDMRGDLPGHVAGGRLDLDNICAELSK